jgi:hypothetical protein
MASFNGTKLIANNIINQAINDSNVVYNISPYFYLHVLNSNTNVSRLVTGPTRFIRQDNEK